MLDVKDLTKTHDAMREARRIEEPAWRDIARIISPDEQDFDANSQTDRDTFEVYDSTPLMALEEFAGGLFGENVNPAERWFELTIADKDLEKWGPVKTWLWHEASNLLNSVSPAASNFYSEATAWFSNLGRYGNGFLYQEEWPGRQRIIDRTIAAGEAFIKLDAGSNLEGFNREFKYTGEQMKGRWGAELCADCQDDRSYQIVHAVYRNPDFERGRLGPRGMEFSSTYFSTDKKDWRIDKGYYELPYHPMFWNRRAGRTYYSGPGHIARADMNMLNEMERSALVDAQFSAEPILLAQEGLFTAADIMPNAIFEGAMNSQGKRLAEYLERGDNSQRHEQKNEQVRNRVREAFKFSMWLLINRPQMTATEWLGWDAEKLRRLGPNLVRVQQGLASFVARRWRILARAGQTAPMPPELSGHGVAVEFVSPLAKAQKLATGRGVMQWIGALAQIAEASGDPTVFDLVNKLSAGRVLHDAMVGLPDVINDPDTVKAIRDARAQQQQGREQLEQMAQGAKIVADVAHASQAMSLSSKRGKAA